MKGKHGRVYMCKVLSSSLKWDKGVSYVKRGVTVFVLS